MTIFNVSTTAAFQSALAQAHAGDSILLASGTYSGISISNVNIASGSVTISSQNAASPAALTQFTLDSSSGLSFSHLTFSTVGSTDPNYAFRVTNSQNISYDSVDVHGVIGGTPGDNPAGFLFENSSNLSVTNSSFEYLGIAGIVQLNNDHVNISGNTFTYMGTDGIDTAGTSDVQISNNTFTNFEGYLQSHPDAIQFWTVGTTSLPQNITISGNVMTQGSGTKFQGIFMGDDVGTLPFTNVTITNNTLYGTMYNGIDVGHAQNLTISNNTVAGYTDMQSWIEVNNASGLTLANNQAELYLLGNTTANTGVTQTNDSAINAVSPSAPALSGASARATFHAGGAAAAIAQNLAIVDTASPLIASAQVAIASGFASGDALNFTNQNGVSGSYNAATGVLTLTGTASWAAYQAALDSVTFSSSAADPTAGGTDAARTISFSVNDGTLGSNTLAATLSVAASAMTPPSLSNSGSAVTYAAGGAAADIAHALGVSDPGSTTLASAQVAITGGFLAGDALNFANQSGITGSYNASTGVLTLTGSASLAAYQAALESITYSSSALDPTHGGSDLARAISFSANDGAQSSSVLTATVNVTQPAPPSLSNSGSAVTYGAGGTAADIAHALGVTDPGSTTLASAQVAITGGFLAGDALNFANQNGITGSYNAATGVLTLTGSAPLAAYQTALESITYSSSALDPTHGGSDLARGISFSVNDGVQSSSALAATVNVSQPPPPALSNSGAAVTYAAGGTAADIAHALGVTDPGSTTLASAQVAITGGFLAGDALNFANQTGITGSYNAATGVLTLTGTASLANYQAALESITYSSSALDPTHGSSDPARTVSFSVNDGSQNSSTLAATVSVSQPPPPSLANPGSAVTYQAGGSAADIAHALGVTDPGSTTLASAQVAITGGFLAGDALNFANQTGITGSYNAATGVLTLTGTASLANYQAALESITYSSSALDPTHGSSDPARTVSFSVNDGSQNSSTLAATVSVSQPPPPSLANPGSAVTYQAGGSAADIAHALGVTDPGSTTLASAQVAITGGFLAGDALNFANQNGITGSYNAATGVLTLSGTASLANYQAALESITYSSSTLDPTHGGSDLARAINFSVNDGVQSSSALAATVNISAPPPPSLSNAGDPNYQVGGAPVDIAQQLAVADTGSTTLTSAQVAITGGFLAGDALNFANQSGITGSYNASTGLLTLSGTASLAVYQTALESITYSSSASDPTHGGTDLTRAVSFSVTDGAQSSSALAATVNLVREAPPTLSNSGLAATYTAGGGAADIAHALGVTDPASAMLASAQVAIIGGFLAGDALNFANQSGITGSYNASTGVLTLSGTASLAAYQAALESITYSSSAALPTNGGTDLARTISFSVNDGSQVSNALAATVNVSIPPLSLANAGAATTSYHIGSTAEDIATSLTVTDLGSATIASARVAITNGFLKGDALNFVSQNGITGSYNTTAGVLTLSGTASLANYQAALDSITFSSTAHDPTFSPSIGAADFTRTISFSINDGSATSAPLSSKVNLSLQTGTSRHGDPATAQSPASNQTVTAAASATHMLATIAMDSGSGHILGVDVVTGTATSALVSAASTNAFIYAGASVTLPTVGHPAAVGIVGLDPVGLFGLGGVSAAGDSHAVGEIAGFAEKAQQVDFATPLPLLGTHDLSHLHAGLI